MSHTTTIDSVTIKDVNALRSAVEELKRNGVNCDLVEDQIPRAYYSSQAGMDSKAPFVVKLNDSRYDVGLYSDGKGGFEARADLFGGDISRSLGAKAQKGENTQQAAMGKLFQTYAIHAATRKAASQGYSVQRVTQDDGTVQLRVAV